MSFLKYLKEVDPSSRLFAEGKAQMKAALEVYANDGGALGFQRE